MRRMPCLVAAVLVVAGASSPVGAYLKLGAPVDGRIVDVTWRAPVRYFVSEERAASVTGKSVV